MKERYFCTLPDITITVGNAENGGDEEEEDVYLGVQTEAKVYEDFENDIWLQYQQKEMQVGDTASLYPWRVEQIVTDTIHNDVARPDFHFEIISGDSVSLNTTSSAEKAIVKAEKPGTSVVKVTYDARDYKEQHWAAISPVNTGYAVFTVGEDGTAVIETNAEFKNWRHYDTIYYTQGTTVPYTFTVNTTGAEKVKVTLNGLEIEGNGNQYTANLENRSNIIGIKATDAAGKVKSMYRIIDARFMKVNVENKTNPGKTLRAGDTANISFSGITMPVYKLATIYNPQFANNAARVEYRNPALGNYNGKCDQWDLATNNDFDVTFEEEGDFEFYSEKGICCAYWGSPLGTDQIREGQGSANLDAETVVEYFCTLPNFTVSVAEAEAAAGSGSKEVIAAIDTLPDMDSLTLRGKKAVEAARKAYEKLDETARKQVSNLNKLEAAERKIQELMETPFLFALDGELFELIPTEKGHYKVKISEQTERVQLERYTELSVLNQSGAVLIAAGTSTTDLKDIKLGEENSFVLKEKNGTEYVVTFVKENIRAVISPTVVFPGTEVTVTLSGLDVPKTSPDPVHQLHSAYSTDIPGLSKIQSAEAKDREEKLSTITFKVPETIEVGTYHLTKGHVFKKWGGFPVQGVMWTGTKEAMFYEDDMPDLELVVKTEDMAAAEEVEALIDDLGEITRLEQEAEVKEAREAYDALTEAQKKLVKNLDKLEKAEAAIEALKHVPEEGGYVTVDIERFTLGQGFYKEPVKIKFEAGETVKDILVKLDGDKLLFNREGTYLAGIKGADTGVIRIPDYISEKLGGPTTQEAKEVGNKDDLLAEFDYSKGSGWYYFVNNKAPNVGMAAYYLKPGDVVRLQFTLLWGMDLTGVQIGEEDAPAVTISNKDEAIRLLGEINSGSRKEQLLANKEGKAAYDEVVKLVQNAVSDQKELDAAVKKLKDVFGKLPENPDTKPNPKPPVDPDEETKAASISNKKYGVTLRGEGLTEDMELVINQLKAGNADVEQMRKKIPSTKALYRAFDIKLVKNGKEIEVPDESTLYIPVGEKYDGQTLQVLHCHDSRVDTSLKGKVSNGTLAVEVDSFSSFGVVVKLKDLQNSDEAAATGKEAVKVTSKVQTGDTAPITLLVIVLIVAAAGIGWVLYKKRKDRGEQ